MHPPFRTVLIANRGEIAVRIIRACHELGMEAVAIYSDADAGAMHVRLADRAVRIGPPPASESYLAIDTVVAAALGAGAEALHPGYGFLAERADFARAVGAAGLAFVGPSAETIEAVGDKLAARRLARTVGVPSVPGSLEAIDVSEPSTLAGAMEAASTVGFPLLVKAAAGGGGRGMRRVAAVADLEEALRSGSAEAAAAFGDGRVYLERELRPARHVEVQLLGDATGRVVAIGERDCSIQRRHQKLVEEAPAPGLGAKARSRLHAGAVALGEAAGLRSAATAEFLLTPDGAWHFLEVNTRLQVEHGVTELVSGLDIVREQFLLAAGRPLSEAALRAAAVAADPAGHAIEVRLAAEDPGFDFAPAPGRIGRWKMPDGPGVRVDAGVEAGDEVPAAYDNLVAKLLVHAADRPAAIARLRRALDEVVVTGIQTTLPFHIFVADSEAFESAFLSTDWVAENWHGGETRRGAIHAAQLVGALDALEGRPGLAVGAKPPISGGDHREGPSPWRVAGRQAARGRWPR